MYWMIRFLQSLQQLSKTAGVIPILQMTINWGSEELGLIHSAPGSQNQN